ERFRPQVGDVEVAGRDERASGSFRLPLAEQEDQALEPERPSEPRQVGSAQLLDETIVPAASQKRVLRSEACIRIDLEGGAHVVVQASDEPVVDPESALLLEPVAERVEMLSYRPEVIFALRAAVRPRGIVPIGAAQRRGAADPLLVRGDLAVEHAQRILLGAAVAVLAEEC